MPYLKTMLFPLCLLLSSVLQATAVDTCVNQLKNNPQALYHVLKKMPKGGELHYHLAGGPSPEVMLSLAASHGHYCLDPNSLAVTQDKDCHGVAIADLTKQSNLYHKVIKTWSMEDFVNSNAENGHDHFFSTFMKFMPIVFAFRPQLLADTMRRAAEQHENYLEIMDIPDNAQSRTFGDLLAHSPSYEKKRILLLQNKAFQKNIQYTISTTDTMISQAYQELDCHQPSPHPACNIKVKVLYYVLREQPLDNLFAQALNAFAAANQSQGNLVGVNLVQPEGGAISLRDYQQQMLIFNYLHHVYPKVHIALHAGELTEERAPHQDLTNHIRQALLVGKAERIGHGSDITYEKNANHTAQYMAKHHIPVEINLSSNEAVLNIYGQQIPLAYYLDHQVPVILSTDDEGILRTDLTTQYLKAILEHNLSYNTMKQLNRNTLTYAFISGKSIWANPEKAIPVEACRPFSALSCAHFIAHNEKAQLQWHLEQQLLLFEKNLQKNCSLKNKPKKTLLST